jgi:hypothetical protein
LLHEVRPVRTITLYEGWSLAAARDHSALPRFSVLHEGSD